MPKVTGNDLVAQTLRNEGVDTVFYLTGGPMSDVARLCIEMQLKSIDVRHEQAAAMMAHAYSRLTGKPGFALLVPDPVQQIFSPASAIPFSTPRPSWRWEDPAP